MIANLGNRMFLGLARRTGNLRLLPERTAAASVCASELVSTRTTRTNTRPFAAAAAPAPSGFDTVGVVGLGLMGHGICQVAASSGVHSKVVAYEPEQQFLDKGYQRISQSVAKLVSKEKLTQEAADTLMGNINFTTDISELKKVDFVVEAVVEDLKLKERVYSELDSVCKPEAIFASNTSSLSIGEMAAFCSDSRQRNFVGVHFFNPVQIMKLVEVIRTDRTDDSAFDRAFNWVHEIGKVPVSCKDTPGFIVNRLLVPSMAQAMRMVDRGDASVKDIDTSMKLGAGHPMGPLMLADYVGLDTCLYILQGWIDKYPNEDAFVVPGCLVEKVAAEQYGRKSGKGFYNWDGDKPGKVVE